MVRTQKPLRLIVAGFVLSAVSVLLGPAQATVPVPEQEMSIIQAMIDVAADGDTITVPAGVYRGHLVLERPLVLDGHQGVTLTAGGEGTVVVIRTNGAQLRGFTLTNSGGDHNKEDAGVQVRGNNNIVKDNRIEDCLFGIDLQQSYNNIIRRNYIASKDYELGMRGDGIRLWYSDDNVLEDNVLRNSRDFVLWYSKRNRVSGTDSEGGRYGMHFMFSEDNLVENNRFYGNSVGISAMYDSGDVVRGNQIGHSVGATGTCISMKEASAITIENNDIVYCAAGIVLDVSPFQPDTENFIRDNRIAFNDTAIAFMNDWHSNTFTNNTFTGNMTDVAIYGGGTAARNEWDGNRWDSYEGFDRNNDGIGDTPHRVYNYAGRVWMEEPKTRFFKGTPLLEVLDFLDRLAPFSEPEVMLEDHKPQIHTGEAKP